MSIVGIIVQLIAGVLGGNAAGGVAKGISLGTTGNSVAGAIGGVVLSQILSGLGILNASSGALGGGSLDIGALIGQALSSGVGGAVVTAIVGFVRSKMA